MSLLQFSGLFVVWLLCTLFIATLTWFEFRRVRFNFNVFFSLLFLLTFFFGFPLTSVLVIMVPLPSALLDVLLVSRRQKSCCRRCFLRAASTRFTMSPTKPAYANALLMYRAVRCLP